MPEAETKTRCPLPWVQQPAQSNLDHQLLSVNCHFDLDFSFFGALLLLLDRVPTAIRNQERNKLNSRFAKSLLSALLVVVLLPAPVAAANSWTPENSPNWIPGFENDWDNGKDQVLITEDQVHNTSTVFWTDSKGQMSVCNDPTENLNCGKSGTGYVSGQVLLPMCAEEVENCINKVSIFNQAATSSEAIFVKTVAGLPVVGYPKVGLPRGDGSHVFSSELSHGSGNEYSVQASFGFGTDRTGKLSPDQLVVRVMPIKEQPDNRAIDPIVEICETPDGKGMSACVGGAPEACAYATAGICAREQVFAPDTRIAVQLKLTNRLTGWFRGRLKDPVIDVQKIDDRYNLVTVEASPVEVARFFTPADTSAGAPNILGRPNENSHGGPYTLFDASSTKALKIVNGYREWVKDTAAGTSTVWTFTSVESGQASAGNSQGYRCLNDSSRLLGIVTTNAMAYEGGAPRYTGGFLNYNLAGMHFLPGGVDEVIGTYDLVMRSDVARCLYGFSKAPISATISVVGGDSNKVATTVVSEKNGWLKLAAYGFTFSQKTVKVKLIQSKSTIFCVNTKNLKRVKKITGFSPTCPTGYKRK